MQYQHDEVERALSISHLEHNPLITESISENFIIVYLTVWTRKTIEFNVPKSCYTIGNSAELSHTEHITTYATNHLISSLWITIQLR